MSGQDSHYYFALNFILYRKYLRDRGIYLFWHLSASVAQTIRNDSLVEKLSVSYICFKENGTVHLFPVVFVLMWVPQYSFPMHNFISLLSCAHHSLYLYFSCVSLVDMVFPEHRMLEQITIRFEEDRYQKWSKWLK